MKLFLIFIYLCLIVSARKRNKWIEESLDGQHEDVKQKKLDSSVSSSYESEVVPFADGFLDLRGGVRKYFALEAALVDHGRNMICSPLSVLMPLGKILIGATNKAEKELLESIGLKRTKQLKSAIALVRTNMMYLKGVHLDVASKIYISSENSVNDRYKRHALSVFGSKVEKIDPLHPKETAAKINDWVADMTRNKINKLLSSSDITRDTSMVLVNAIYFAGKWKHKFETSFTGDFHSPSGVRRLPMMSRQGHYKYWKCDVINAEVIQIPYEGSQASMIIVLPFSNTGLPVLLRALKLSPKLLNKALEKMKFTDVILTMPKFKIESTLDLMSLLKKIGLKSIFDTRSSGLSGIIEDEEVFVSAAIHKAVIEVNEKGTEAAAATGIVMGLSSGMLTSSIRFEANRPFLFYITIITEQLFAGNFNG